MAVKEGESLSKIANPVIGNIHPIAGIRRTVTCMANTGYLSSIAFQSAILVRLTKGKEK